MKKLLIIPMLFLLSSCSNDIPVNTSSGAISSNTSTNTTSEPQRNEMSTKAKVREAVLRQIISNEGLNVSDVIQECRLQRDTLYNWGFFDEDKIINVQIELITNFPKSNKPFRDKFMRTVADVSAAKDISYTDASRMIFDAISSVSN